MSREPTTQLLEPYLKIMVEKQAVTLLNLRDASRHSDAKTRPATTVVATDYVDVLSVWRYRKVRYDLTVHDFFFALARLEQFPVAK